MKMKRCYRGCPNRQSRVWERCSQCKKKEIEREMRRQWWMSMRELDNGFKRKIYEL